MNTSCSSYPKGVNRAVQRMVVIGDIHGCYSSFIKILRKAQLIDTKSNWAGRNTHMVLIGDILDRGGRIGNYSDEQSEYKLFKLINKLIVQSKQAGGNVHVLLGNHEIMNVLGDFSYVSKKGMTDFNGQRVEYFKPGNKMAQFLACNANSIVKIGSWIFSHAGITHQIIEKYNINQINNFVRQFLLGNVSSDDFQNSPITDIFWNRTFGNSRVNCNNVQRTLRASRSKHMVVGHTVQDEGINSKCSNGLYRVDTGSSNAFGRIDKSNAEYRLQCLEIINDTYVRIIK